jgi:hypothetical protein
MVVEKRLQGQLRPIVVRLVEQVVSVFVLRLGRRPGGDARRPGRRGHCSLLLNRCGLQVVLGNLADHPG